MIKLQLIDPEKYLKKTAFTEAECLVICGIFNWIYVCFDKYQRIIK